MTVIQLYHNNTVARYQSQLFLSGCDAVVDVEKRDDSKEIDFYVCVKKGMFLF